MQAQNRINTGCINPRANMNCDTLSRNILSPVNQINDTTSYPGSFHYAPRWRKDPGPGWSRVSQILGDNNWDL